VKVLWLVMKWVNYVVACILWVAAHSSGWPIKTMLGAVFSIGLAIFAQRESMGVRQGVLDV
jgi:hypothetical protein